MSGSKVRHRGGALAYVVVLIPILIAFTSLSVDIGRVQLAKTQLRALADATALYSALALPDTYNASAWATLAAADNSVVGSKVPLQNGDVQPGNWDDQRKTFILGGTPSNAVQVTTGCTVARGNALPLIFASLIGQRTCDVNASAIAFSEPTDPYGIVGIDYFRSHGLLTVDSYPSGNKGDIATNGDITLNLLGLVGVTYINGDARPGQGKSVIKPLIALLTDITGSTQQLDHLLNYPPVNPGSAATLNNNIQLPAYSFDGSNFLAAIATDIPSGTYYVNNFTLLANIVLRVDGPVTFYVTGDTTIAGSVLVLANDPANFKIRVINNGPVLIAANTALYCDLYAPLSPIQIVAGLSYTGGLVGEGIDILATSFLHYDEALGTPGGAARSAKLVK